MAPTAHIAMADARMVIGSYNSTGFNLFRQNFIATILPIFDILMIQEHWQLPQQLDKLNLSDKYSCHATSGVDPNKAILQGRPYGGTAIYYRKSMASKTKRIRSISSRITAITITTLDNNTVLVINAYLPTDSGMANIDELEDTFNEINLIIQLNPANNVIVGGDLNCDFARNTTHVQQVANFAAENQLDVSVFSARSDVQETYAHAGNQSCIDHFMMTRNVFDEIVEVTTIDDVQNTSMHCPVKMTIALVADNNDVVERAEATPKVQWSKATDEELLQYRRALDMQLASVELPDALLCDNTLCQVHSEDFTSYCSNIVYSMLAAEEDTIPNGQRTGGNRRNNLPGWTQYASPLLQRARMWHAIWVGIGRPQDGHVAQIRKQTRKQYHDMLCSLKQQRNQIDRQKLFYELRNTGNLWGAAKKCKSKKPMQAAAVNGECNPRIVCQAFAAEQEQLFNSVPHCAHEARQIETDLNDDIANAAGLECSISSAEVAEAILQLNAGKSDGDIGLTSDHVKYAGVALHDHLALMYSSMLVHNLCPDLMNLATVCPIPKPNKDPTVSNNYRGIALASSLGKVLDYVLLNRYRGKLTTHRNQFGFKRGCSAVQCACVFQETVNHYRQRGSRVYACFLDLSKAFDKVSHVKLMKKLQKRKLPPVITRYILTLYKTQRTRIRWGSEHSAEFASINGVRQGAVSSPILFSIFIDELLTELEKSKIGCSVDDMYVGCLAYADDIALLATSIHALQRMIKLAETFAFNNGMSFSAEKSVAIAFTPMAANPTVRPVVGGADIEWSNDVIYLGNKLTRNLSTVPDVARKRAQLNGKVNLVKAQFGHMPANIQSQLFSSYCSSFYGCELWHYFNNSEHKMSTGWQKGVRRVWDLPRTTHCGILPPLQGKISARGQLHLRFVNFLQKNLTNGHSLMQPFILNLLDKTDSFLFRKKAFICQYYGISQVASYQTIVKAIRKKEGKTETDFRPAAEMIRELVAIREGVYSVDGFTDDQLLIMLNSICTL
jgi:exonuclease III